MGDQKRVNSVEEAETHFADPDAGAVLAVKEGEEKEIYNLDDAKEFFAEEEKEEAAAA